MKYSSFRSFIYPASFVVHGDQYLIKFRDLPEANTFEEVNYHHDGNALDTAEDCLRTAILRRFIDKDPIPKPSRAILGEVNISILLPASELSEDEDD
jgi:hypothetical protein